LKFSSKPIQQHREVPLADEGHLEQLFARIAKRDAPDKARETTGNACYVVSVRMLAERASPNSKLAEIVGLVQAQGDRVVGTEMCRLAAIDPRTFFGSGFCIELAERAFDSGADMLVLDAELSPSQMRNLQDAAGLSVCDREAVIFNVFLRHCRTRRARIQVETAQLEYLRPRIRGLGLNMDQQAGGVMRGRGPGETASELMARRLDRRLADLRHALSKLKYAAQVERGARADCATVALVGYTNAGKTSLMNGLTGAGLSARDMPFETLDTTCRSLCRHGTNVVLSDTVGFIRNLPERLLASFESTLSEIVDASLLVVVVDLSDDEWPVHLGTTAEVLVRLGADQLPRLYVFNKLDRLEVVPSEWVLREWIGDSRYVVLSSQDKTAVAELKRTLLALATDQQPIARVFVPFDDAEAMAALYRDCQVLATEPKAHGLRVTLQADARVIAKLKRASLRRD
jgi:GTP-binding protein HflX